MLDFSYAEIEKQKKKMASSLTATATKKDKKQLEDQIDRVERLKKLFEGIDCFNAKEKDPEIVSVPVTQAYGLSVSISILFVTT